ncbi:hypothetical protein CRYUN_Cryun05aG0049400 [Craigia yunnanensis]
MQESKQGDARIYIVSTLFLACIVSGGAFLCLYMFRPEAESAPWYPVVGIILVGIPWIFWIGTYIYRCCAYCCQRNGGNVNRVQCSLMKTQSYASAGPAAKSMHSSENEDSPLRSPNGDHRHVHFGEVVVLGSSKYNQNDHGGGESQCEDAKGYPETEHEGKENSHDSITSDKDCISAASRKGEAPLIVSVST